MTDFLLTILFAGIVGFIFLKLKVPGGMMVGAIFGAAILNLGFGHAYMPYEMKVVAQMISGAFIAVGIDRNDLKNIKRLAKPLIILVSCMLVLNMISGFVIYNFSNLDITTAFFCAIPGGMSDIPIIAGEMGADSTQVALLQFVRMCVGISTFPLFIQFVGRKEGNLDKGSMKKKKTPYSHEGFIVTLLIAVCGGLLGKMSGMPAGTLLFALISVLIAKQFFPKCMLPMWARRTAQVFAGSYIATGITPDDIPKIKELFVPAVLLVCGYLVGCIVIGLLLKKFGGLTLKEGMLAATPAGASDMALISADIGISSPDVAVLSIGRMLSAIIIFPQVVLYVIGLLT